MFRKLRIKFIAIIMASVAAVLAIVFVGICMAEYQRSLSNMQNDLSGAVDRAVISSEHNQFHGTLDGGWMQDGRFGDATRFDSIEGAGAAGEPEGHPMNGEPFADGANAQDGQLDSSDPFAGEPPRIGGRDQDRMRNSIPLAVYTFVDGTLTAVTEVTTAYIATDVLDEVGTQVSSAEGGHGTLPSLGLH